jgi:hypothetical protein
MLDPSDQMSRTFLVFKEKIIRPPSFNPETAISVPNRVDTRFRNMLLSMVLSLLTLWT